MPGLPRKSTAKQFKRLMKKSGKSRTNKSSGGSDPSVRKIATYEQFLIMEQKTFNLKFEIIGYGFEIEKQSQEITDYLNENFIGWIYIKNEGPNKFKNIIKAKNFIFQYDAIYATCDYKTASGGLTEKNDIFSKEIEIVNCPNYREGICNEDVIYKLEEYGEKDVETGVRWYRDGKLGKKIKDKKIPKSCEIGDVVYDPFGKKFGTIVDIYDNDNLKLIEIEGENGSKLIMPFEKLKNFKFNFDI